LIVPRARYDDVIGDLAETRGGAADALLAAVAFAYYRARARWWEIARWMTVSDLRLGVRLVRKEPILSGTAVFALAAAIAVACMGYTFAEQMLSATLPFANGDRFVRLDIDNPPRSESRLEDIEILRQVRARTRTMEHVGVIAIAAGEHTLELKSEVVGVRVTYITSDTLPILPYTPLVGRTLLAVDDEPGAMPAILIREGFWRRHLGASPEIVGRPIQVGGVRRTVVGVMSDRFEFPFSGDAWIPYDKTVGGGRLFGILRQNIARDTAQAELQALIASLQPNGAEDMPRVQVRPFAAPAGDVGMLFPIVLGVILMTLLVVVGNVAVLMTARGWARSMELAVRTALGASRMRIVGQLTAEVALLGSTACALGVAISFVILRWIDRAYPEIPFWIVLTPGPYTLLLVSALALVTIALAGVWPALIVTSRHPARPLQAARGGASGAFGRTAGVMITVQVAIAVALLSGAVSMTRAFLAYLEGPAHVDGRHILTARINLPPETSFASLTREIVEAASTLSSASTAGVGTQVPRGDPPMMPVTIEAAPFETFSTSVRVPGVAIGPGFLEAIGGRALSGRLFTDADTLPGALPTAIVNASFVSRYLGGRNPLGRRILAALPRRDAQPVWCEIVGVVPDLGVTTGDPSAADGFYVPLPPQSEFRLVLRTTEDAARLTQRLRTTIAKVDPRIRLREVMPLDDVGSGEKAFLAGVGSTMIALGVAALALSIVSVYALLSFAVTRRTREIGVRVALGATPRQIVTSLLGSAGVYLVSGATIGAMLGVLLMQARALFVFRMAAAGVWVIPAVIAPLIAAGVIACWVPTHRALAIDPADSLKTE
jgi:predicted permease